MNEGFIGDARNAGIGCSAVAVRYEDMGEMSLKNIRVDTDIFFPSSVHSVRQQGLLFSGNRSLIE